MEVPSPMEPLELRPVEDLGTGPPQPPSPLSGCYLLIVIGEPHSEDHKEIILQRIAKGFLSWDSLISQVDLEKELQALTTQAPEGEEARNGERLIQYATENLVTEVLIHPQVNTLVQCVRNLLSSFTRHRHLIHAGYTFAGNGSWILQDGTFSLADFTDAFQEVEVQRVLRAYENSVTVDVHCSPDGDWTTERLSKEPFSRSCKVRVNPDDTLTAGGTPIGNFINYISPFLKPAAIEDLLEPSDVVGNIRFSHPTLYVFPGGQGDAALFGINGFNMLVDGGFGRKSCFWDFARHLDRLDAVLMTRINNGNISGVASLMRRKKQSHVYPQIGHFFCNLQDRRTPVSPDGDKDRDPLLVGLGDEGQDIVLNLRHIQLRPHCCYREGNVVEPVNLYHKVGHGKLDMYIISPTKDSREVKDFLARWNASDARLFAGSKKDSKDFHFPLQNLVSICALLVWQPANPNDTITRILFPGSTPQHKIFEGLEKLKHLEFLKHPVCSMKSITPSGSTVGISSKIGNKVRTSATVLDKLMPAEKENMREASQKAASMESNKQTKSATIPVASDVKAAKVSSLTSTPITKVLPPLKHKVEKPSSKPEPLKRTEANKSQEGDKPKKTVEKKIESKAKVEAKVGAVKARPDVKPTRVVERKVQKTTAPTVEKKTSEKASPTTPKKTVAGVTSKIDAVRTARSTSRGRPSPTATPAKSAKDANNRKVVESKSNVTRVSTTASRPPAKASLPKKEDAAKPERKPIARKPRTSASPIKRGPGSPAKTTAVKAAPKTEKESAIRKIKSDADKPAVDSSEVSTPSTAEAAEATLLKAMETVAKSSALLNGEPATVAEVAGEVQGEPEEKAVEGEEKVEVAAEAAADDGEKEVEEEAVEDTAGVLEGEVVEAADDEKAEDETVERQESAEVQDEDVTEGNDVEDDAPIEKGESLQAEMGQQDAPGGGAEDDDEVMECDNGEEVEEEEEYLIIEREEREAVDESLQEQESAGSRAQDADEGEDDGELKKQRDEVESEKEKHKTGDEDDVNEVKEDPEEVIDDNQDDTADRAVESSDAKEIDLDEAIDAKEDGLQQNKQESELDTTDDIDKLETLETKDSKDETNGEIDLPNDKLITKENKEQIEEEVKEIILSAAETVSKKQSIGEVKLDDDERDEGSDKKKSEEGEEAKELSSISPEEKLDNSSEKNREATDDNREVTDDDRDTDQRIQDQEHDEYELKRAAARDVAASADQRYPAEESQPDEKFSATAESAATTAPTLPEDERIPLDEIKEIIEEKHTKEETKEKDAPVIEDAPRHELPTTLPQVVIPGKVPTFPPHGLVHHRDIVKTPDEVADLPMHEEVDPGMYESNEFDRDFNKIKDQDSGTGSSKKQDSDELRRQSPELEITGELQLKDEEKQSQHDDVEEAVGEKVVKDVESGAENQNAKDEEVKPDDAKEIVGSFETVESGVKGHVDESDVQQAEDARPEEGAEHDVMDDEKEVAEKIKESAPNEETQIETKQNDALISKGDEKLSEVKDSHEALKAPDKETGGKEEEDKKVVADANEEDDQCTKEETKNSEHPASLDQTFDKDDKVDVDVAKHDDIKQLTMSFIETEQLAVSHVDHVEAVPDSVSPVADIVGVQKPTITDTDKPGVEDGLGKEGDEINAATLVEQSGEKPVEGDSKETKVDDVFEEVNQDDHKGDEKIDEGDEQVDNEKNEKICYDDAVGKELEDVKADLKEGESLEVDGESLHPDKKVAPTAISNEDLVADNIPRSELSGADAEVIDKDAVEESSEVKEDVADVEDVSKPTASPEPIRETLSPVPKVEIEEKIEPSKVETISESPNPEPTKKEQDQGDVKDDAIPKISQSSSPDHKADSKSASPEPIRQSLSPEPKRDEPSQDRTRSPSPDVREGSTSPALKPAGSPDLKVEEEKSRSTSPSLKPSTSSDIQLEAGDKSRSASPNAREGSVSPALDLKVSEDWTRSPSPNLKEGSVSPALKPSASPDLKVKEAGEKSRSASPDVREGSTSPALKPSASPDLKLDAEEKEHEREEHDSKPSSPDIKQGSESSVPLPSASPDLHEHLAEKYVSVALEHISKSSSPDLKDDTNYPDNITSTDDLKLDTEEKECEFVADLMSKSPTPDMMQGSLSPIPTKGEASPNLKSSLSPEPTETEQEKEDSKAASPSPSPNLKSSLSPEPTEVEQEKEDSKAASPSTSPNLKSSLSPEPTETEQGKEDSKAASPSPGPNLKSSLSPEPTEVEQEKEDSKAASPSPSLNLKSSLSPEPTETEQGKEDSNAASPSPSPNLKSSLSPETTEAEQEKEDSKAASPSPSPNLKSSLSPEPTEVEQEKEDSKAASPSPSPNLKSSLSPEPTEAEQEKEDSKAASPSPSPNLKSSLSPEPTEAEQEKEDSKAASPSPSPNLKSSLSPEPTEAEQEKEDSKAASPSPSPNLKSSLSPEPTEVEQEKEDSNAASPSPSPNLKSSLSPEPTEAEQEKEDSKAASPSPSPNLKSSLSPEPTEVEQEKEDSKAASPSPSPNLKSSLSPEPTEAEQEKEDSKAASPSPSPNLKSSLSPEPTEVEQEKEDSKAASPSPSPNLKSSLSPEPTETEQGKEDSKAASPSPSPNLKSSLSPEPTEAEQEKEDSKAASPCPSPDLNRGTTSPAISDVVELNGVSDEKRDYSKEEAISKSASPVHRETVSPDPKTSEPDGNKEEAKQHDILKTASPEHKPSTADDEAEGLEKHDSPKKEHTNEVDENKAGEERGKENGERADSRQEEDAVYENLEVPDHPEVVTMSPDSTQPSPRNESKESSKESEMKTEVKEIDEGASKSEKVDYLKEKESEPTHKENKEVEEELKKEINNDTTMQELRRENGEDEDEKKDKEKEGPVEVIKSAVSSAVNAIGDFGKGLLDQVNGEGKASADEEKPSASVGELVTEKSDAEENLDLISTSAKNVKEVVTNEASILDGIVDASEDVVSRAAAKISSEAEKAMDSLASEEEIDNHAVAGFSAPNLPSFEGLKIHENLSGILSHTLDEKSLEEVKSYIDNVETHLDDAKLKLDDVKLHLDDEKSTLLKQPIMSDLTRKESSGAIAFQLDNGSFDDDDKAISSSESDDGSKPKLVEFLVGDEKIVITDAEKKKIADDAAKADQANAEQAKIDEQQIVKDVLMVAKDDERPITPATSITSTIATDDADTSHLKPAPGREQDISQSASDNDESVVGDDVTTVKRMLVTASSEDGGAETEVCPSGSITFTTSLSTKPSCEDLTSMLPDTEPLDLDDEGQSDKRGDSTSSKRPADEETDEKVKGNQDETGERDVKGDAHADKVQKVESVEISYQNGDSVAKHATNGHLSSSHEDLNGHETFETKSIKTFSETVQVSTDKKVTESQITSEASKTFQASAADKSEVVKELQSVETVVSGSLEGKPALCDLSKIPGGFSVDSSIDLLPSGVKKEIDQAKTSLAIGGDVEKLNDNVIVGEEKVHEVIIESRGMKEIVSFVDESADSGASISGVISGIKKHDSFRSATPGSDDVDMGGPLSPMSDISSGQVSRVPDSRNYESDVDDDGPMTPSSVTSQHAHSPTQTHFQYELGDSHVSPPIDIRHTSATLQYDPKHAMEREAMHKEPKSTLDSAMTSSFYGELSLDPLQQLLEEREEQESGFVAGARAIIDPMTSSFYASRDADDSAKYGGAFFHTESDEHSGDYEPESGEFDFERAMHEHRTARGVDMMSSPGKTYRYETKSDTNGKASPNYLSKYDQHSVGDGGKHFAEAFGNGNVDESHFDDTMVMNKEYKEKLNGKSDCKETTSTTLTKEADFSATKTTTAIHDPLYRVDVDVDNSSVSKTQKPEVVHPDEKVDPIQGWGKPLGLPSPAPPPTENTSTNKGTPKKEKKPLLIKKSLDNKTGQKEVLSKKRSDSPVKQTDKKGLSNKDGVRAIKATGNPIYLDLTYVPHHGNSYYSNVEFFKKVRARYYVFSGTEPSREVYNALLEAKQAWDDKELEVTIIPTYDTDILGYWVAENEDILAKHKIDLSPSASRCTINLQDHETSCSAYRLEF